MSTPVHLIGEQIYTSSAPFQLATYTSVLHTSIFHTHKNKKIKKFF